MDPLMNPPPGHHHHHAAPPSDSIPTIFINLPPYSEMIATAIRELSEPEGSSQKSISSYIVKNYKNLPPNHPALLTHQLTALTDSSKLLMVNNNYKLPGSAPTNGPAASDPPTAKRGRGRPPKAKAVAPQPAVPVQVFENSRAVPVVVPVANDNGKAQGRARGRPRKDGGSPKVVVPAAASGGSGSGRGRGRPPKKAVAAAPVVVATPLSTVKSSGRPRGRPKKLLDVNEGVVVGGSSTNAAPPEQPAAATPVAGKRRGRPPKAVSEAKKPRVEVPPKKVRKYSGKPLGRPRKKEEVSSPAPAQAADTQLLVAYIDLKAKYDNMQSKVKQSAGVIKPCLTNGDAVNAFLELEALAEVRVNVPANVPIQQPLFQAQQQAGPSQPQPQAVIPQFQS